jgi:hypothetical protein
MATSTTLANRVLESVLRGTAWTVVPGVRLSLHNADPGTTGASEISGGGYARQTPVYGAAAGGQSSLTAPVSFTNMPAGPVTHVGIWSSDASPVFLFSGILGTSPRIFVSDDTATELLKSPAHGLSAGTAIRLINPPVGVLPAPLAATTLYYVVAAGLTVDRFSVSLTNGGAAIDLTTVGEGSLYVDGSKTLNSGDTFTLNTDTVTLT